MGSLKLKSPMVLVVAAVIFTLIGGDLLWSYWQGTRWMVKSKLREATSIEFDLARLDQAIEDLTPVLRENKKTAAQLDVEIEFLEADTRELEQKQALAKGEMQELRNHLKKDSQDDEFRIGGRTFRRVEVEEDLSRRLQAYQQQERHLKARQSLLAKQRATFNNVVASIKDNDQQQLALAQTAEALNGELRLLEMSAETSGFALKRPALSQAQELATTIEKRIRTMQKLNDQERPFQDIPVNLQHQNAVERFDELFVGDASES